MLFEVTKATKRTVVSRLNAGMQEIPFSFCGLCKVCRTDSDAAIAFKSGIRSGAANQVG
jgi:hypothetical protein